MVAQILRGNPILALISLCSQSATVLISFYI